MKHEFQCLIMIGEYDKVMNASVFHSLSTLNNKILRLRLHEIGYVQIRLGSDPLW